MRKLSKAPKSAAQLLAEYSAFPDDQPVTEQHAAPRLVKSRAWMQWKRHAGGGPKYYRTDTGKIFYRKRDIEAYLDASLTFYANTSQYSARGAQ
jgi:hypothetical protein